MKEIPGYPGYFADENGAIYSSRRRGLKRLKPILNFHGYHEVHISKFPTAPFRRIGVHVLVLLTFKGERPDGTETRHLDGNRTNNHWLNLEWGTRLEQAADRERHGTNRPRRRNRFTDEAAHKIRQLDQPGIKQRHIAQIFETTQRCINKIVSGKWARQKESK